VPGLVFYGQYLSSCLPLLDVCPIQMDAERMGPCFLAELLRLLVTYEEKSSDQVDLGPQLHSK
jgi:hypothetical protein